MSKPRLIKRARDFAANAGAAFAVAGAIESGRKPARADLERLGIDADAFYTIR
jgi:hypothetical protein